MLVGLKKLMNWRWILKFRPEPCSPRGSGSEILLGSYLTSLFSVQRWSRLLSLVLVVILQFLPLQMSIVLETRNGTLLCENEGFNSQGRKTCYTQLAFDIYVIVLVWSHPETKTLKTWLLVVVHRSAHFCKVLIHWEFLLPFPAFFAESILNPTRLFAVKVPCNMAFSTVSATL